AATGNSLSLRGDRGARHGASAGALRSRPRARVPANGQLLRSLGRNPRGAPGGGASEARAGAAVRARARVRYRDLQQGKEGTRRQGRESRSRAGLRDQEVMGGVQGARHAGAGELHAVLPGCAERDAGGREESLLGSLGGGEMVPSKMVRI